MHRRRRGGGLIIQASFGACWEAPVVTVRTSPEGGWRGSTDTTAGQASEIDAHTRIYLPASVCVEGTCVWWRKSERRPSVKGQLNCMSTTTKRTVWSQQVLPRRLTQLMTTKKKTQRNPALQNFIPSYYSLISLH